MVTVSISNFYRAVPFIEACLVVVLSFIQSMLLLGNSVQCLVWQSSSSLLFMELQLAEDRGENALRVLKRDTALQPSIS